MGASIDTLYNTGVSDARELLGEGEADPHYTITFSADPEFPGPDAFTLLPGFPVGPWLEEGPDSRWIAPQADQSTGSAAGMYTYSTSFELTGVDPSTATIEGRLSADNSVVAARLNGVDLGMTSGGFNVWSPFTIPEGSQFFEGVNTLEFDVSNAGDTANPTGLRVEMIGRATGAGEAPEIVTQPQSEEVLLGQSVTLTVDAVGTPPLDFQWHLDGEEINGATDPSHHIQEVSLEDHGAYTVVISNSFGEVTSDEVTLDVVVPFPGIYNTGVNNERAPIEDYEQDPHYTLALNPADPLSEATFVQDSFLFPIVTGPWLANTDESKWIGPLGETGAAPAGEYRYQLMLDLTGFNPSTAWLSGKWASDDGGSLFLNGTGTGFASGGFGSFSSFRLEAGFVDGVNILEFRVTNGSEGYTGLRVTDLLGSAEEGPATDMAPEIVTQPQSATRAMTESYTFIVIADGTQPFSYDWFHNGELIEGASENSFTVSPILPEDSGAYTVRVSNTLGASESDPAELTVIQPELGVFGTGVDSQGAPLPLGEADPHYLLLASADPAAPPHTAHVATGAPIPPWLENTETSQWITPRSSGVDGVPGSYTYRLIFTIPEEDVNTAAITAGVATDDGNGGVFLNGVQVELGASGFGDYTDLVIPEGSAFAPGLNTLDFVVNNGGSTSNPTGLRVENILLTGVTLPPPAPELTVSRIGGDIRISWPVAVEGFTLQQSSALPGGWANSTASVTVEGDENVAVIPMPDAMRFFRLIQ